METFGEYIRKLRDNEKMPLRKLAAALDIDQSTLSKIERNERRPTKEMAPVLAKVFKLDEKELKVKFLSDKVTYELKDEDVGLDALKVAEQNIQYQIKSRKGFLNRKKVISIIQKYLSKQPIEKAWLFGSYARNEQDAESDIDIMVRFKKPKKITLFDYVGYSIYLEELLDTKIDIVEEGCVKPHAAESVEKEKLLFYERKAQR